MEPALLWLILFLVLAALAAVLIRRWQSRRALVQRLGELSTLAEIGRALSGAPLDLPRLAEAVREQATQIVPAQSFQLGLFEEDRYRLLLWVVNGERRPPAEFRLTPDSLGILGWVRENRQSLLVHDFERQAHTLPAQPRYSAPHPPRSGVFVPLLVGEHALGALALQCPQPNAFTEEHLRLLNIVANHAAAAVENARLYEQSQRRATQLELVAGVAQRVNVLQPLPQLIRQVVALVAETFAGLVVSFYETDGDVLRLRATAPDAARRPASAADEAPAPEPSRELPPVIALGQGLVGEAAQACQALSFNELPALAQAPNVGLRPGRAELAVPVEIDARVLGVLHAYHNGGALIDDSVQAVFQSLAAQMALAILEAQVYAAEQRRADQFAALSQASRTVTSSLELDDMLDEVLDMVDDRFGYKAVRIFLLQDDRLVFQAGIGVGTVGHTIEGLAYDLGGPGLIALVGRNRQLLRVDDVSSHPDYVPGPGLDTTRSELAAPLVMGARLLGVLDVQSDRPGAFNEEDARTVQALADTLAVAVRNARLFEYERRRRHLAEIMREVSVALTSTLQLDNVLELILDGLALVVTYDAASILLANDAGQMVLRATRGAPGAEEAVGLPLAVRCFAAGEAVPAVLPFHEVDLEHAYHDLLALPEPHACLGAPLAPGGTHAGYLVVDCAGLKRFQQSEVELIATFASQAAVAIENARLYTAQREQAWISTALLQVADATARTTELDDVLATVARLTPLLVGVDRCAILMADGERWRLAAYAAGDDNANDSETLAGVRARFPEGLVTDGWARFDDVLAAREPVVLEPEDDIPPGLRELFIGVVILLPLLAKGQVEGVLIVGQVPGETPFTAHRIRLMGGIANQAALAIESAMLLAAQQEEAWVTTALLQVAESVAGQPLEQGLETASRLTPILVGIDKLAVYQYDAPAGAFRLRQVAGLERPSEADAAALNISLGDMSLAPDDPIFTSAVPWRLRVPPQLLAWFGAENCFVWPLRANDYVLGALVVEANELMGRRLTIMNGIAYQLAMAMENARLAREVAQQERLERELEVGRDIQASFLPHTYPQADGWEITAFWRSARQVGGDFYDFIALTPGANGPRWGIVIADVADKGVPAALFMALSRTLLRTVAINRIGPAETLGRVNELILSDSRSEQFVTVFYGVWEPETGSFRYAVGGHNPPLWARVDGTVQPLPGRGIALGVLDGVRYTEQQVVLARGEALLLYTDGLTDAVNNHNEEFGLEHTFAVLRATQAATAEVILSTLAGAVQAHVGAREPFDDMTMVVLKHSN